MVDATWQPVSNEAGLVAASARISRPRARSYLAVSVQDLMAADTAQLSACGRNAGRRCGTR